MYGESGRFPVDQKEVHWLLGLTSKSTKLVKLIYNCANRQVSSILFKWLTKIKQILDECGLSEEWLNQSQIFNEGNNNAVNWSKCLVEERLEDQFIQE